MPKHLEQLELGLREREINRPDRIQPRDRGGRSYIRNPRQSTQARWLCGEVGHFQCNCPLNFSGPAQVVGGLAKTMNDNHQKLRTNTPTVNLNTILYTDGFANSLPITFLLDSGAAVSVVRFGSLSSEDHRAMIRTELSPVSANGTPLHV